MYSFSKPFLFALDPERAHALGLAGIEVDRKILADLAVNDIAAFNVLVDAAKAALPEDVNAPKVSA